MIGKKDKPGSNSAHFTRFGYVSSSDKTWAFLFQCLEGGSAISGVTKGSNMRLPSPSIKTGENNENIRN